MNSKKDVYGVGPIYGLITGILTITSIVLSVLNIIPGRINNKIIVLILIILGICFMIYGFILWKRAVFDNKLVEDYIEKDKLCTEGVYGIVRNPCYTGVMFICTGIIIILHNIYLFILPFIFWGIMTIFVKEKEEKYLLEKYKKEYINYCKNVNRCIPWVRKKWVK